MLKDNGNKKRKKYIKCDKCKERFELCEEEIIKIGQVKYYECPYCSQQVLLK